VSDCTKPAPSDSRDCVAALSVVAASHAPHCRPRASGRSAASQMSIGSAFSRRADHAVAQTQLLPSFWTQIPRCVELDIFKPSLRRHGSSRRRHWLRRVAGSTIRGNQRKAASPHDRAEIVRIAMQSRSRKRFAVARPVCGFGRDRAWEQGGLRLRPRRRCRHGMTATATRSS